MDGKSLPCRGKPRQSEEESFKEVRRKDDKKKQGDKSTAKSKSKLTHSGEMDSSDQVSPVNGHNTQSSRYHQREVPPRFQQQHKHTQKYTSKTNHAVTKKPTKDTTRWTSDHHTHTPSQDHTLSNSTGSTNDGGWSTGLPAKGSGWRKSHSESSNLNEWGQAKKSSWGSEKDGSGVEGWDNEGKVKSEQDNWGYNGNQRSEGGWASDQDEGSSRSQSPGGIVMVVKQTTPSKDNASSMWESKPVGSNWKMHTLDTKPADEAEKRHGSQQGLSSWDEQDALSSNDTESTNQRALSGEGDVNNDSTHPPSADRFGSSRTPYSSSQESDTSQSKLPSQSDVPATTTLTQEVSGAWQSGRTSANSTSPTEVNSSGKVGMAKGGPPSRSTSPRKLNRYDQTSSSSNSLNRGAGLVLPRPRKAIAELEGGLDSLHSAPSGWGKLPSPKTDDMDKGTEFWGIPPDDLARMTGNEHPPIINGWGGSRSPHSKGGDYPAESAGWPTNEIAGKGGWGEDGPPSKWEDKKLPHSEGVNYYDSPGMTSSASEPHLYTPHSGLDVTTPPVHTDTTYPLKTPKWNTFDEPKDPSFQPSYGGQGQSQMIQNQLMVKDLVLRYQQLAKLQLGQIQSSGNIQSLQKSLSQQLSQAQMVRQKLISQAPISGVPPQHPLKLQLSQTNDIIMQIKQHIGQNQQMLAQQNPMYGARVKGEGRQQGHTQFTEGGASDLSYGMRDMSVSQRTQGGQQVRSVSKLHRIISSQDEQSESLYASNPPVSSYASSSPFSPPLRSSSATTMAPQSLGSKPVHQIQEFKPGVPWQPRKSDPKQLYGSGGQRSMSQSTGGSFGQQGVYGGAQRFTRSQSTDNSFYGNQAPPPANRGEHPWSSVETRPQNFPQRSWNSGGQRSGRMSLPSTPVGTLPEHGGWRQPPSTLLPKQEYQYRQFEATRRGSRSTPIDAHPDNSQWGSFPETPTSADSVWGKGVGQSEQGMWPQRKNSRGWSQMEPTVKESYQPALSENRWSGFSQSEPLFAEWQSGKKTRLSSSGVPLSPWLVIKANSAQLNMQSIKDTCKGFGDIKSFIGGPDYVLVGYSSVEEAVQVKPRIDGLWGGHVSTEVVPEGELEVVLQQLSTSEPLTQKVSPPSSLHPTLLSEGGRSGPPVSKWEDSNKVYARQASTPGSSSVWSDGGFLSGISSPWSSDFSGTLTSPSAGYHSDDTPSVSSVSATPEDRSGGQGSSLSTFLPNGLL